MDIIGVLCLRGTKKILLGMEKAGKMRYSEIVKIVGYSSTTTRALKNMEKHSIVRKEVLNEPYRPVSYSLTDKGRKLATLVKDLESL
jgi:DNA-binding HxlR family transcriptional regulator